MADLADLRRLYRRASMAPCKGLCVETCYSYFGVSKFDNDRIALFCEAVGREPVDLVARFAFLDGAKVQQLRLRCPYFEGGRCVVHTVRPMPCRLYGASEIMKCGHGCEPEGGLLTAVETIRLLRWAELGYPGGIEDEGDGA